MALNERPIEASNTDQFDFWNAETGRRWVDHQDMLDSHMAAITARLFERAAPRAGEAAIDVGCGAGETTLRLARAVGGEGSVLALDISEVMLARARERAAAEGLDHATVVLADAQLHDFTGSQADLLLSRFGVMFFGDPPAAFRNLARGLRPGARVQMAAWGPLAANPWFNVPREVAIRHFGPPEPQPPHAAGPMGFADADHVAGILAAAGYEQIAIEPEETAMVGFASIEAEADFICTVGPGRRAIQEHDPSPEVVAQIVAEIADAFRPYLRAEGLRVPATINFISATRP